MKPQFSKFCARLRDFMSNAQRGMRNAELEGGNYDEVEFNSLALELFELQFAHNAAYGRFCESRGVSPRTVNDWREIPAMPMTGFKEWDLSCLAQSERTAVFHSSGTTEQRPSRHFHNAESLAIYEASLWPWFERHLLPDLKSGISDFKLMILTPPKKVAPHSSLVHMFDTIRHRQAVDESVFVGTVSDSAAWTLDFEAVLQKLQSSGSAGTPLLLLGTAFSFVHLIDFLGERELRFRLPVGSRVMETGGYKGRSRSVPKEELHALIERHLGVPESQVVCEYGMSELSSQAYDKAIALTSSGPRGRARHSVRAADVSGGNGAHGVTRPTLEEISDGKSPITHHASRAFHFPPWARLQIISPETGEEAAEGETGLIRAFDLANVFSVMAVQTEDLGVRHGEGFELIGRATAAEPKGCSLMAV